MEWHDIQSPADPELDRLAELYQLHPLHIEDCRHRGQNAKVEENPSYLFIVLKVVELQPDGALEESDLDLFLGKDYLITLQEADHPRVREIFDRMKLAANRTRPDQTSYRILDAVVDSYLPTIDHCSDTIDELEEQVLEAPTPDVLAKIFATKRLLIQMRRILGNTRDVTGHLQRTESEFIAPDLLPFLRDVYDHLARSLDRVEMQRDLLTSSLDIYLSSVANRTNQVMKVLTVLGTIALPSLVISGFFGMNVQALPWLHSAYGGLIVLSLMVASTTALLVLLKFLKWL
jgi:magnesium transporter